MMLLKVTPLTEAGNIRALVEVETPDGDTFTCRIIKQDGFRAYLDTQPHTLTHKEKRHLQREAVKLWADQISDTLPGLLESERVFKGSSFSRSDVQLKIFCPVCDINTRSEFSPTSNGGFLHSCYFCGTRRIGRPYVSRDYVNRHIETLNKLNACEGTRGTDEAEAL